MHYVRFTRVGLACALAAACLVGCATDPIAVTATENPQISTELMFSHDGCRIYRFHDGALPVYYADCRSRSSGGSVSTAWPVSCGRGCVRTATLSTAQ